MIRHGILILMLVVTGCKVSNETTTISAPGEWKLSKINGEPVFLSKPVTLNFNPAGQKISGFAGCNQYFGNFSADKNSLKFSLLGSTKMYCDSMDTETKFLNALAQVNSFSTEDSTLVMLTDQQVVLEFKK